MSVRDRPRHSRLVRVTHWLTTLSVGALLVSGFAILVAHPRLYWGETGFLDAPSLVDLPIPLTLGHSGWGRYLHFLSAWVTVVTGLVYVTSGLATRHFHRDVLPTRADLAWRSLAKAIWNDLRLERPTAEESLRYNAAQRLAYLAVVFVLFPLMIVTGLAMSPAITSVVPGIVDVFGGHQSARTVHFFAATAIVLFVLVHVTMVSRAGFISRVGTMIAGGKEHI